MIGLVTWHQGRCGSSVLGSLLNQHSQIQALNEVFSKYMPRRRGDQPIPTMAEVLNNSVLACVKPVLNVEIKYLSAQNFALYPTAHLDHWFSELSGHGLHRHLLIHRRNGLRRVVSHLMAQRTGVYVQHKRVLPASDLSRQLTIDRASITEGFETHSLLGWLEIYDQAHQQMREGLAAWCLQHRQPAPLELFYEEVIEPSPQLAYGQVCAALGLEPEPAVVELQRINPEPLAQLISNWSEIEALLAPTRFAWMLAG
jgi:hypothetical protein